MKDESMRTLDVTGVFEQSLRPNPDSVTPPFKVKGGYGAPCRALLIDGNFANQERAR